MRLMRIADKPRFCLKLETRFLDLANQIAMYAKEKVQEEAKKMMKSNEEEETRKKLRL